MSVETDRNWFLLTSKPHKDEVAEFQLRNQGYDVYRPLAKRLRTQRGKVITKVESLFPRYMFIHLDHGVNDNWAPIRSTTGISSFVRFGTEAARVPEALIMSLKQQEAMLGERAIDLDRFHTRRQSGDYRRPFPGAGSYFPKIRR